MTYELFAAFLFGAVIGSFLNVCIYRLPKGLSIVSPPSQCPNCNKHIPFYDNIPILSYLVLRGKCRFCKGAISPKYPFVEFLAGIAALSLFYLLGPPQRGADFILEFLVYFIFLSALIVITFIDIQERIIPNEISLTGIGLGLVSSVFVASLTFLDSLIGVILGGGILITIAYGYYFFTKREGMGGGDVKLLAMIGAFLGWKGVLVTLFAGSFVGAFIGTILMVKEGKDTKYAVPFGPFLALGAVIHLYFGEDIINWYLSPW